MIPSTITLIHIFDKQLGAKFKNKCISSAIFRSNSSLLGGFYISFGCIIMILLYSIIYYKISKQVSDTFSKIFLILIKFFDVGKKKASLDIKYNQ